MVKPAWLKRYHDVLQKKPDMGEIEWREHFLGTVIRRGLGYTTDNYHFEAKRTDIRIVTDDGISHIVFETKMDDDELNTDATWDQAKNYLRGGETYVALASPHRIRVFTPRRKHLGDLYYTEESLQKQQALWWRLSAEAMKQAKHLEDFRDGKGDYCFIKVEGDEEGFKKLIDALRLCTGLLRDYVHRVWERMNADYQQYLIERRTIEEKLAALEADRFLHPEQIVERKSLLEAELRGLQVKYGLAVNVTEDSFDEFKRLQPYSRDVSSTDKEREQRALERIYLTNVTYSALNRIFFIRIAEDEELVTRKISNGGIKAWRDLVGHIQHDYRELLKVTFADAAKLYSHFFEEGIFEWYRDVNADLSDALEKVFYLLNSFDLKGLSRDTLGEIYQEYLHPKERKRLGEFYTPLEVVDYILEKVGWPGDGVLLDPACGSGGFTVRALKHYLDDLEARGLSLAARLGMLGRVIGLDINPFASHIAEMNMLFLLLPTYLQAKRQSNKGVKLQRIPVYTIDSLYGPRIVTDKEQYALPWPEARLGDVHEALRLRDSLGCYGYVVGNPPYVRNERLPEPPRSHYRRLFRDVATRNADIFTYFVRKAFDWLAEGGKFGFIVSLGLADAEATSKLRAFLNQYTIERIVPLEWASDIFVSNVIPIILIMTKRPPEPDHQVTIVHGITARKQLLNGGGHETRIRQSDWLSLADGGWRVEIRKEDLPILDKLKALPMPFNSARTGYGMALRTKAKGRLLVSKDISGLEHPYPLLDGREVKSWSIEWQGRYINYIPELISDPKSLQFFKSPKVLLRRISLTSQAAVDESKNAHLFLARNTVMVVRSSNELLDHYPHAIAAIINSLPTRYYAFLMLRAGVLQGSHRATFYSDVVKGLPCPQSLSDDKNALAELSNLSQQAHEFALEMCRGDRDVLQEIDRIVGNRRRPFVSDSLTNLAAYQIALDLDTASLEVEGKVGKLRDGKSLTLIEGHPAYLEYIVARAFVEMRPDDERTLSKHHLERALVPASLEDCARALEILAKWQVRKPTLYEKLQQKEHEINEFVLDHYDMLTKREKRSLLKRCSEFPMSEVLKTPVPGAPTRKIAVKMWEPGERYQ